MSNNIENLTFGRSTSSAAKVSYTINNYQPVISTIIGSQPLFYMDYNADIIDDGDDMLFDAAELGILENEISTLKKQVSMLDRFAADFTHNAEEAMTVFAENAKGISEENSENTADLTSVLSVLKDSRIAEAYLECADKYGVKLELNTQVADAIYNRKDGIIEINAHLSRGDQVLLAARELRRHFQHRQGALLNPLNFHPDSAILINRAQEADLITSVIRVAWELQLSGHKFVWERVENSSFSELGRAFTREAFLDFRTINNGFAATATFESWFLSERCRAADKALIRKMLANQESGVFDTEQEAASITPSFIAALGEMPFGKNYLAQHALTIMEDPIFTEVRDRSNANFLWFIKFERTFRETEQELQSDFSSAAGIRPEDTQYNRENISDEKNVVTLFAGTASAHSEKPRKTAAQGSAQSINNVVYLRAAPGEPA